MKKQLLLLFFSLQWLGHIPVANARQTQAPPKLKVAELQPRVKAAVKKAYAASVLMWEFDTIQNTRMSAQFSGVVVSANGEVLSAAHVVIPGKTYQLMFPDGRQCIARGMGRITIPPTFMLPDAAMLKIIDKGTWPFVEMGWSSSLKINQPCISIAYPESLEQRRPDVRFGHITLLKNKHGFMESTCVMEPGDSGGPLFDLYGRLIGIHSGIEVPEDINYEIPADVYRKYHAALMRSENYAALPTDTSAVGEDTLAGSIATAGDLLSYFKNEAKRFKATCLSISSIIDGTPQTISGTIFSTDGLPVKESLKGQSIVLSKSSMIGDGPLITLPDGKTIKASVMVRDRVNDLAILLPISKIPKGISLLQADAPGALSTNDLGAFLISTRPYALPLFSVLGSVAITLPQISSYGYLGAVTARKEGMLLFTFIQPGSAAEAAGITTGDQLLTVDSKAVTDGLDMLKALQKLRAGDTSTIVIIRNGGRMVKKVVLKYPPPKITGHPADHFAGGKSIRRDGFENVFVHDARITPTECGGPVFTATGNWVGINIARLSRTSTIALPASVIKHFIVAALIGREVN
jgi:serine protease Do